MKRYFPVFSMLVLGSFLVKGQVSMQATLPSVIAPNTELAFDVKITKGAVANFAKYQIDVPNGVTLSEVNTGTGSFSFENNRGKIIWVNIPSEAEFVLTFKLNSGTASGSGTFNQKFYFLEGGSKKEVEAAPITVNFGGADAAVAATPLANNGPTSSEPVNPPPTQVVTEKIVAGGAESERTVEPPAPEKKETPAEPDSYRAEKPKETPKTVEPPVTTNSGNLVYKIQIGAYGENPGKAKYQGVKDVNIVREGDFYKVLVGNFKNREEAVRQKEELLQRGFKGFVVTYQNGARVK
jgi:hypothetical protein